MKRFISLFLVLATAVSLLWVPSNAKTLSSSKAENVFVYATDSSDKSVLLKVIPYSELETLAHGRSDGSNYSVSSTDNYPTTQYCEGQGFTANELLEYVMKKTTVSGANKLTYKGSDTLGLMATDSYGNYTRSLTYDELYGVKRYFFEGLYGAWNTGWEITGEENSKYGITLEEYNRSYKSSDKNYEAKRAVFKTGVETAPILMTRSYSGRTTTDNLNTSTEPGIAGYVSANGGKVEGCLKNALTDEYALRLAIPMTEADLMSAHRTAYDSFKWIYNLRFNCNCTAIKSKGTVAEPAPSFKLSGNTLTVTLSCATAGASIYYGFNGATQTLYTGPITVDVSDRDINSNPVTIYATAVKEGYDDAGVMTFKYPGSTPGFQTIYSGTVNTDLTFTAAQSVSAADWSAWTGAMNFITVKTPGSKGFVKVDETKYKISASAKTITFDKSVFAEAGSYSFKFHATKFADKSVSVTMKAATQQAEISTASGKTKASEQTVGTTLFYVTNSAGEEILVSRVGVSEMESDMAAGYIDGTNHNYSLLDRYVTTVHQEAQGFTVAEYVAYAQSKSTIASLRNLNLTFSGKDEISFWEIDQNGYDSADTYTYDSLYGVKRYNFPLLYEYWDYRNQDYYDPAGVMSRDEVIDYIFANGEPETVLLSVQAYSQRYMVSEKYNTGDYNMENLWNNSGLTDSARTIRVMKPMTEAELRSKSPTASDTRYWVSNIRLDMEKNPDIKALGKVAAPTATVTEDGDNYYVRFSCTTKGATIYYNHNYRNAGYTPTMEYTGEAVVLPKSDFKNGLTITARAVKDGYTDAGVVTLQLTPEGTEQSFANPYSDVESGSWYYGYVRYVTENKLFDATASGQFSPEAPMTRAMLATALYRMAGSPKTSGIADTPFTDVSPAADYANAVAWCYTAGVVNGTSQTTFDPSASITREQIVTMFSRYAEKVAKADMTVSNTLTRFTDKATLSSYAAAPMQWAVAAGMISGMTTDTIVPRGTATRAQTAAMVQRLANFI